MRLNLSKSKFFLGFSTFLNFSRPKENESFVSSAVEKTSSKQDPDQSQSENEQDEEKETKKDN